MKTMKYVVIFPLVLSCVCAFLHTAAVVSRRLREVCMSNAGGEQEPLLLRAAKGEKIERVPVWMMRQAGRHMQVYS